MNQPPLQNRFILSTASLLGLVVLGLAAFLAGESTAAAAESAAIPFDSLATQYTAQTQILLKQFCLKCHSTDKQEGELDLERFKSLTEVRRDAKAWIKVVEMLDNGEMPPKDAPQPTPVQKQALRAWIEQYLHAEALANAGDPGPVVLRRLNNAEYNYTIRDLTGVELNPTREFPVDGAAGEGFTNTGNALVMSPALLTKYLDAGKEIAQHAVLVSDGIRFSPSATRSDWTNDALAQIRALYGTHTGSGGASQVNLQGIVFNTNDGGRLPVEQYLAALLSEREALLSGRQSMESVARAKGISPKYLGILWNKLQGKEPSLLFDDVRHAWRTAKPEDAVALAKGIEAWQQSLWRFTTVGHIGKVGGPKSWQEPITPLVAQQDVRLKLPPAAGSEISLYLAAGDAGDGSSQDLVVWQQPRLVAAGRPELLLRDVREFTRLMTLRRERAFASTAKALKAASELAQYNEATDLATLAQKHEVDLESLTAWLDYLGIGSQAPLKLDYFTKHLPQDAKYDFVKGWGSGETPLLVANSSEQHVRIPGNMKPHGVCVHPSPTLNIAVGWRSPITGVVRLEGEVTHAHPECGNGVTWSLELRRGTTRQRLASGNAQGGKPVVIDPIDSLTVQPGDLISLLVGPRDGNHSCDLTAVELVVKHQRASAKPDVPAEMVEWSLSKDVSPDVLANNPHADRLGNKEIWHFYTEPIKANEFAPAIAAGTLLARWQAATTSEEKQPLAEALQTLLLTGPAPGADEKQPDTLLYRQLASLSGPLFNRAWPSTIASLQNQSNTAESASAQGLDPALFGKHPTGGTVDPASLCVQAPAVLEVKLPGELAAGAEFVTTGSLHPQTGSEGSVQLQVSLTKPELIGRLRGDTPVIATVGSKARQKFEQAFADFRELFPAALCYTKIVPVDEVVTLTLFYREDEQLQRLMLSEAEIVRLNRLWDELHFVSNDAFTLVDAFTQLMEYATQDSDPRPFEPLRQPILDRAAKFRQALLDAEPKQLAALIQLAGQAYRRPLTPQEASELEGLYHSLRKQELPHEEALRFTLARIFMAPAYLYRLEKAPAGTAAAPISDWELASRLSYFLWSSQPDEPLRALAASGRLKQPEVLVEQSQRMLADPRIRRLATEFACQWLHIYDFAALDEKSERHFPEFARLRGEMYEESIRFFADAFQQDASVLSFFQADHTFVNEPLAQFYGIPLDQTAGAKPGWRRVDGLQQYGRGGLLGFASTLAKQSGASRTSPILRGNWISEVLLGEKLPKPPKDVPRLPEDEAATDGLTVRQLVEKHTSDARCATCHQKIDPFGFSLEGFDAIGRRRANDLANRPIETKTKLPDGQEIDGLTGLRNYLIETRRAAILRQFCRKLLGYALGRGTQLSDDPLLTEMQQKLKDNDYRFSVAIQTIVLSRQFREIRGRDMQSIETP